MPANLADTSLGSAPTMRETAKVAHPNKTFEPIPLNCPHCGQRLKHVAMKTAPVGTHLYVCPVYGFFELTAAISSTWGLATSSVP